MVSCAAKLPFPSSVFLRGAEAKFLGDWVLVFVIVKAVHSEFALDGGVPVVFDGVVGASWQPFGNEGPSVP